nr:unnamed protein product [Callosobruchus chinensis]
MNIINSFDETDIYTQDKIQFFKLYQSTLFILVTLVTILQAEDPPKYKSCTETDFCKKLRKHVPKDDLKLTLVKFPTKDSNQDNVVVEFTNSKLMTFKLTIELLKNNLVRVKLTTDGQTRYEIPEGIVLEREKQEIIKLSHDNDGKIFTVVPNNKEEGQQKVIFSKDDSKLTFQYGDKQDEDFALDISFQGAKQLYGLHHHAYNLELTDTTQIDPFRLRNTDRVNFKADSTESLYGSVPVLYGYSPVSTSGVFLHNAAEQWVDIHSKGVDNPSAQFIVLKGSIDLFVLLGPQIEDLWTLGYHQCRWTYDTQDKVLAVLNNMTNNNFPMDAIWLDIDYTNGFRYFTWNPKTFPKPKSMLKTLGTNNKKLVAIIDPHIKVDDNYTVYGGAKTKYFVKNSGGTDYVDFHQNEQDTLAGIWNDMNEPSVENRVTDEMSMPYDLIHKYKKGENEFIDVKHGDIHNIYGLLHTMSTHKGLIDRDNNRKRPFILTRSHFAGSQRFAAMWTGDNTPDWAHLKNSYSECMLSNLVGHVFCGADIPGFFKDPVPSEEFVYRAYQAGIWLPFFRGHATKDAEDREPYRYNATTQELIRSAIKMRYRHIPTWYQLFYEHTQTGAPVIRPLFYNFSGEVGYNDHIMLGDKILARPVFEKDVKEVTVHLPGRGQYWYRIDGQSVKAYRGGTDIKINVEKGESPVFYRGGSIIVTRDRDVMSTAEGYRLPLTVYVNLDKDFKASGKLYNDDGVSFDYKNGQKFLYAHLWFDEKNMLQVEPIGEQDHEDLTVIVEKVVVNDWAASKDLSTHHTTDEDDNLLSNIDVVKALRSNGNKLMYRLRR